MGVVVPTLFLLSTGRYIILSPRAECIANAPLSFLSTWIHWLFHIIVNYTHSQLPHVDILFKIPHTHTATKHSIRVNDSC